MELEFVSLFDIPAELGRGCASTAWNVANLGVHHWMLALYDERAQEEVWSKNPDALIASGIAYPQGRGRRVDGGFVISGLWNFSSGVDAAEWNMLAVTVRDGDRVVDHRMCLVPGSDYEIVDDWHVLGMRSTGSKSVRATDLFVPEHRALCMYLASGGSEFPGAKVNPNPLYRVPLSALGSHCLAAAGVGNAQAALELTVESRILVAVPLFHAYGLGNALGFPLAVGATAILEPARPPRPALAAELARNERPTLFFSVPTFYAALLAADLPEDTFASTRHAVSAGEPLPAELFHRFGARFGVEILDGIGSTEMTHIYVSNRPGRCRPGSSGTPVGGYRVRLADEQGNDAPADTPGQLWVSGDSAGSTAE
jgi:hypothetical protein